MSPLPLRQAYGASGADVTLCGVAVRSAVSGDNWPFFCVDKGLSPGGHLAFSMQQGCFSRSGLHWVPSLCPPPGDHRHTARPSLHPTALSSGPKALTPTWEQKTTESKRAALGRPRETFNPPPDGETEAEIATGTGLKPAPRCSSPHPGPGVVRGWREQPVSTAMTGLSGAARITCLLPPTCRPPSLSPPVRCGNVYNRHSTYQVRQQLHTPSFVLLSRN